jgi:hypothetical protein
LVLGSPADKPAFEKRPVYLKSNLAVPLLGAVSEAGEKNFNHVG